MTRTFSLSGLALLMSLALAALGTSAHATEVTVEVREAATNTLVAPGSALQIGRGYKLKVFVQRDTGAWTATTVTLGGAFGDMKHASFPVGPSPLVFRAIAPTTASYTPLALSPLSSPGLGFAQRETPRWTFSDQSLALADTQELELWFALDSQTTLDGTPTSFTVELAGTRDGGPVTASASFSATAVGDSPVRVAGPLVDHAAMTLLGVPGVRVRYRLSVINGLDASDGSNTAQIAFRPVGPAGESMRLVTTAGARLKPFRLFSGKLSNYFYNLARFVDGAPHIVEWGSGTVLPLLVDAPYPARDPTWPGAPTTFRHHLDVDDDGLAVPLVEEDLSPTGQVSVATLNATLVRRTFPGPDGTAALHIYDGVGDYSVLDVFVACADLVAYDPNDPDYQITVTATAWDRRHDGSARSRTTTTTLSLPPAQYLACGGGLGLFLKDPAWDDPSGRWINGRTVGVGARADFEASARLPSAAEAVEDFAIIDRLPVSDAPRASSFQGYGVPEIPTVCGVGLPACPGGDPCVDGQCPGAFGVRVYYCDSAADFDHDAVAGLIASSTCRPAVLGSTLDPAYLNRRWAPPPAMTSPTHVVWYTPSFAPRPGRDEPTSGSPSLPAFYVGVAVTTNTSTPAEMRNTAWYGADFVVNGVAATLSTRAGRPLPGAEAARGANNNRDVEVDDALEDDGWYRVVDFQCLRTRVAAPPAGLLELDDPSDRCTEVSFYVDRRDDSPPATGVTLELVVPDGVEVTAITLPASGPGCVVDGPALTERPLVWEYGACALGGLAGNDRVDVRYCLDPDHPFVDGDTVSLTLRVTGMDHAPASPPTDPDGLDRCNPGFGGPDDGDGLSELNESGHPRVTSTVAVLGRQTLALTPSCEDDDQPAFRVELANPAGKALTGLIAEVALPDDATFAGVSGFALTPSGAPANPNDGEFQVDLGSGFVPLAGVPPGSWPAVVAVRWVGNTTVLAPYLGRVRFVVHLAPLPGEVGPFLVSGLLTSNELPPTQGSEIPYVLGDCQPLTVEKFFDADEDGIRDPGEPPLRGWDFTVTHAATQSLVATLVTDALGRASVKVQSGLYTVTELDPVTAGPPSWRLTTPNDVSVTVTGPAFVQFGNVCVCEADDCATATCTPDLEVPRGASCGASAPITCDDGDLCTIDTCEASTSSCVYTEVGCLGGLQPGFFASVRDASGSVVGAIRCATVAGQVTCETQTNPDGSPLDADGDGRPELRIYQEWADACVGVPPWVAF